MKKKSTIANRQSIIKRQSSIKRVLIVDDSLTDREYLKHIINGDPDLEVIGEARNGEEAVKMACEKNPDIITMDIYMPGMDGYQATRKIMETSPVPIIIVTSGWDPKDVEKTFRAMNGGALCAMEKPKGPGDPEADAGVSKIVQTLKTMAEVKVVRRNTRVSYKKALERAPFKIGIPSVGYRVEIIAVGASTGGPPALQTILSKLSKNFSVPLMIVQHIAAGFLQGMVEWLQTTTPLKIRIAGNRERIRKGYVYFAPEGCHMGITGTGEIALTESPPENGVRPSVSHLFRSIINNYGEKAVGILLTGMGKDGAMELKLMKEKGAITIAQSQESSVVYGMPGEAVKLNGARHIFSPEDIAGFLNSLAT